MPWFDMDMRELLRRKHPFFLSASAEYFLAYEDGEPRGRIELRTMDEAAFLAKGAQASRAMKSLIADMSSA